MNLYYLGPVGTHSHEAAAEFAQLVPNDVTLVPCPTIGDAIVKAVAGGQHEGNLACVPMENSIQGSVTQMWDTLMEQVVIGRDAAQSDVFGIQLALTQPIHHYKLYPQALDADSVTAVYSHPQALAQCRMNIQKTFRNAKEIAVSSTAEAARIVGSKAEHAVAIASLRAGKQYGLATDGIPFEDRAGNVTRFALLAHRNTKPVNHLSCRNNAAMNVVSLCLRGVAHSPGGLVGALAPFAESGLNLERVESRPVGDQLGNYVFYVDVSVNFEDGIRDPIEQVVERLNTHHIDVVMLGSYQVVKGK